MGAVFWTTVVVVGGVLLAGNWFGGGNDRQRARAGIAMKQDRGEALTWADQLWASREGSTLALAAIIAVVVLGAILAGDLFGAP